LKRALFNLTQLTKWKPLFAAVWLYKAKLSKTHSLSLQNIKGGHVFGLQISQKRFLSRAASPKSRGHFLGGGF